MRLFHLVAAWLFPCAVCATTLTPTGDGAGGMAAEPSSSSSRSSSPSAPPLSSSSTGVRLEFGTSSSQQQRSRSASPPCFGRKQEKRAAARAATNGQTVAADEPTTEHHRRKSQSPPANATDAPVSSTSASSSPPSLLADRLGLTMSPPRGCSVSPPNFRAYGGGSALSRSPEAEKGGTVGSYLRRISKRLTTRSAAADEESPRPTMIPNSFPLIGEGMRKGGSAIATEEEIRAFVIANGSRAIPLV
ncbi:hypothetical protein E2562_024422 [Oryza meyeriana var. granulata]|uniref:Uncharacterized protein n=1 Tax=Oryza meyeriana var. granulata TaxID=110450 RepID=A0A6G1EYL0_9ORYZ|nr:hypothetical protein E2562_024422 [Oryza meyeriana var. granulata]